MRGIIFILLLIAIGLNFLVVTTQDVRFFILLGLGIFPIMLAVYFDKLRISLFVLLVSCIWASVSVFFGVQWFMISAMVLTFITVYIISSENKTFFLRIKDDFQKEIDEKRVSFENVLKENDRMERYNKELNIQSEEIEDLYEITKRMSAYLRFSEIFKILCSELKNIFGLESCRLINIKNVKGVIELDEIYSVITEGKIKDPKSYDKKIAEIVHQKKESLSIASVKTNTRISELNLPKNIVTLLAIPIIIKDEVNSLIIAENVKEENFDKFSIVIGQFSLELRKAKLYELVEKLAMTDGLTNLLLRRQFLKSLSMELERASTHNLKLSILMMDIDNFKKFNDKYGHLVGDRILVRISDIIRNSSREIDLISRYGGEEFAMALPETDKEGSLIVAERIRSQIEKENFITEGEVSKVTVSIGISSYPDDNKDITQLIDMSDQALYEAKESGRNNIRVYSK